ncbi:MAG: site-specific DNA-methyltransferase, partial [Bacteroidetes bacterium]
IGKEKVINHHQDVPYKILEPQYTFSNGKVNKNTTSENKIIHGDNLEALKSLLPEYEGKIKCIYIDPPYNTGNEGWVYNDNVNHPKIKKWLGEVVGRDGEDLTRHDKWLCMMYPRLKLLHKLLADDGAIFISVDDNEQANLKLICDEIFGNRNFITNIIWEKSFSPVNLKKHFSDNHDFILCYGKKRDNLICNGLPRNNTSDNRYKNPDNDHRGVWMSSDMTVGPVVEDKLYKIVTPSGKEVKPASGRCWLFTEDRYKQMLSENRIWFGANGSNMPRVKKFLSEVKEGMTPMTIWKFSEVGHSQDAAQKLKEIFDSKAVFDYPKSVDLVKRCFELYSNKDSIILDSFAGSGTTAHAVMKLNQQDGGNRKFILVELEDYASNITAERIKRVNKGYGKDIKAVNGMSGAFDYFELGLPLFDINQNLNEQVSLQKIREYIWFSETHTSFKEPNKEPYFLGKKDESAYYFIYEKDRLTTLDFDALELIKTKGEQYIIYADNCLLPKEFMAKKNIIFKKIPRDITRF